MHLPKESIPGTPMLSVMAFKSRLIRDSMSKSRDRLT